MRTIKAVALVTLVAGLAACSTLGRGAFREPEVTFRDAKVTGLGLTGGSLEVALEVYNPNNFKLDGTRLTYSVLVDSIPLGGGAYESKFTVTEKGTSTVKLPISFTYSGIGAAGRQLMETGSVKYRVRGDVTVATPLGSFTRPYDQTGTFNSLSGPSR